MKPETINLLEKGHAHQQKGFLSRAEKCYRRALQLEPDNEFALNLMAVICIRKGKFKDAVQFLKKALGVNPNDAETHNNLGLACKELNLFTEAQSAFEQSLIINPRQPVTLNNLGNVHAAIDHHEQAIRYFESALALEGSYADCLNNLSVSLKEAGRLDHALQAIDRAIGIDPQRSASFNNKGQILLRSGQYQEAREAFEQAIRLDNSVTAKIHLSTSLKQLGHEQAALRELKEVLELEANNAEAHNHLGVLYEQLGEMDRAARHFRRALQHEPGLASAWYQLSKLKGQKLSDSEIALIKSQIKDPKTLDIFRTSLYFALAWHHENLEQYTTSIEYFIKAQDIKAKRRTYDGAVAQKYLETSKQLFPVETGPAETAADGLPVPVFVVGMPRSGTTLTEQIISSHSQITAAGELGFINDLARDATTLTGKPFPHSIVHLSVEQRQQLRTSYLQRLVDQFGYNRFIVDKNPLNFNFTGLIASLFPEARILYCKRDPMDNCVSIFRLPFDDNQGYSHKLSALGHYYCQHEKLMDFWQNCYPQRILPIQYEETVSRLEAQSRRMLEFIGVAFEEKVLDFHENQRIVMTPSAEQVRQPIYQTSVNTWKRYGPALEPLHTSLKFGQAGRAD